MFNNIEEAEIKTMFTANGQIYDPTNAPITIQDIVTVGSYNARVDKPTGEFGNYIVHGGKAIPNNETSEQLINRLFAYIERLVSHAAKIHFNQNFFGSNLILPGKENNITRLVTNEFFFYTQRPFTMAEFQQLQQKIADLSKNQPENLHLILGTFAVLTPKNNLMNVAVFFECGRNPQFNFTVKNVPSSIDPVYTKVDGAPYLNVDSRYIGMLDHASVSIDGKEHPFTFNNVFECKTVGDARFYSCIEICLDHVKGTAKVYLGNKLVEALRQEHFPLQCTHVIVSNVASLSPSNCVGYVTHADPYFTPRSLPAITSNEVKNVTFGTPCWSFVTHEKSCSLVSDDDLEFALRRESKIKDEIFQRLSYEDWNNIKQHIFIKDDEAANQHFLNNLADNYIIRPSSQPGFATLDIKMPNLSPPTKIVHTQVTEQFMVSENFIGYCGGSVSAFARLAIYTQLTKMLGSNDKQFLAKKLFELYIKNNKTDVDVTSALLKMNEGYFLICPSADASCLTANIRMPDGVAKVTYKFEQGRIYSIGINNEYNLVNSISEDVHNRVVARRNELFNTMRNVEPQTMELQTPQETADMTSTNTANIFNRLASESNDQTTLLVENDSIAKGNPPPSIFSTVNARETDERLPEKEDKMEVVDYTDKKRKRLSGR